VVVSIHFMMDNPSLNRSLGAEGNIMSIRFSCSQCGAIIIEHAPRPDGQSECPRCRLVQPIPTNATITDGPTQPAVPPFAGPASQIVYPGKLANPGSRLLAQVINNLLLALMLASGWALSTIADPPSALIFWLPPLALIEV
jgi:hypothetical protein